MATKTDKDIGPAPLDSPNDIDTASLAKGEAAYIPVEEKGGKGAVAYLKGNAARHLTLFDKKAALINAYVSLSLDVVAAGGRGECVWGTTRRWASSASRAGSEDMPAKASALNGDAVWPSTMISCGAAHALWGPASRTHSGRGCLGPGCGSRSGKDAAHGPRRKGSNPCTKADASESSTSLAWAVTRFASGS